MNRGRVEAGDDVDKGGEVVEVAAALWGGVQSVGMMAKERKKDERTSATVTKCWTTFARFFKSSCARMHSVTHRVTCKTSLVSLVVEWEGETQKRRGRTAFDMSIIAEMFGASLPNSFGHALLKHSCGVMRWKSRESMMVSWRASSRGSRSMSLNFFRLRGTMGVGRAPGARLPIVRGAAPCSYGKKVVSEKRRRGRRPETTNPLVDALADLQRLPLLLHRVQSELSYPLKEDRVEVFVVHVVPNPGFEEVRNAASADR
jgi:hypothetical protein